MSRWLILPVVTADGTRGAKYADAWSGRVVDFDAYPDVSLSGEWYLAHVFDDDADTIAANSDVYAPSDVGAVVADVLDTETGLVRSKTEWGGALHAG